MIYVIGTGPGSREFLTRRAEQVLADCDILAGWPRLLSAFSDIGAEHMTLGVNMEENLSWLAANKSKRIALLASGDPMLYGIGKRIAEHFVPAEREIIPGISSVQYLFSKAGIDMNDVYISSSHGKTPDFDYLLQHRKVALVTDNQIGPYQIAQQILIRGLKRVLIIGEKLGYSDEKITQLQPHEVGKHYEMNIVVVMDERQ